MTDELGGPENYVLRDQPLPTSGAGEVRVKIKAVGIGYADVLMSRGAYQLRPALPFVPGSEFSGVVDDIGAGSAQFSMGDRICGITLSGCCAEYISVPATLLIQLPEEIPFEIAQSLGRIPPWITPHPAGGID